ncbi:MAG: tetratricopeptide repeat protein [Treponemataceae bacterium]
MKKHKLILIVLVVLFFLGCQNKNFLKRMQENEEGVRNPSTIPELEEAISKYERRVEDIMLAQNRIAIWHKMLGTRYMDSKMYLKALDSFTKALEYYPDNHNLYYQVGLCASHIAKKNLTVSVDEGKDAAYYNNIAVNAYLTALEIQPNYNSAAYALSVLYVYELNESEKAIPLLQALLQRDSKNYDAMFVLAAAYYLSQDYNEAIKTYRYIIENTKDKSLIDSAEKNILQIEGEKR